MRADDLFHHLDHRLFRAFHLYLGFANVERKDDGPQANAADRPGNDAGFQTCERSAHSLVKDRIGFNLKKFTVFLLVASGQNGFGCLDPTEKEKIARHLSGHRTG